MDTYAPFDSGAGSSVTEDGWRAMQRRTGVPGVIRDSLNGMLVYADSTGMQVKVKTGELWAEGHYGSITVEKIVAIATAHATLARIDRIVARLDYVNNQIVVDAVTGTAAATPAAPAVTRNSSIFEISLAEVSVPAADTGIDAAQVTDARAYGGPTVPTVVDDNAMFGDKISTLQRNGVSTALALNNGNAYMALTIAQRDAVVSSIRFWLEVAQVGGAFACKVYTGWHRRNLVEVSAPTLTMTGTADVTHVDALPSSVTILAGQYVAFAVVVTSAPSTPAQIGHGPALIGVDILNTGTSVSDPTGRWSTVFKGGQSSLASTVDGHDGTWSKRNNVPWFALG